MEKAVLMVETETLLKNMGWSPNYNSETWTHARGWVLQARGHGQWAAFYKQGDTALGIEDSMGAAIKLFFDVDKRKLDAFEKLKSLLKRIRALKEIYSLGLKKATETVNELNDEEIGQ